MIDMHRVHSSLIHSIGYDADKSELHVNFHSGNYIYHDVPPEKHKALMAAESHGKHVAAHIKGHHRHTKKSRA